MAHGNREKLPLLGEGETADIAWVYFTNDSNFEVDAFSPPRKSCGSALPVAFIQVEKLSSV